MCDCLTPMCEHYLERYKILTTQFPRQCYLPYHDYNCKCGGRNPLAEKMLQEQQDRLIAQNPDLINHPPHYTKGGIDTFDFIKAKGLSYTEGNVIKYITRSRHKGNLLDDLKKAEWYLKQLIAEAEKND